MHPEELNLMGRYLRSSIGVLNLFHSSYLFMGPTYEDVAMTLPLRHEYRPTASSIRSRTRSGVLRATLTLGTSSSPLFTLEHAIGFVNLAVFVGSTTLHSSLRVHQMLHPRRRYVHDKWAGTR